jgi:hypothetical protein
MRPAQTIERATVISPVADALGTPGIAMVR